MKGIVFTEFLEMVEEKFGYETVDALLTENKLPSGGIYTSVGTYDHSEIVTLLGALSQKTGTAIPILLNAFGQYLFFTFKKNYPVFLDSAKDAFDFLESIERYIHVEVRKLYPDAELPNFTTKRIGNRTLEMIYYSERKMSDFAEGLIRKSIEHYEESATIVKENLKPDGTNVKFTITKT